MEEEEEFIFNIMKMSAHVGGRQTHHGWNQRKRMRRKYLI
jgi:hypothetical protein